MRIQVISILSFCALIILGTIANPVAAQERAVGVSIGDTFKYYATFDWGSSDPNATLPSYYQYMNGTEWKLASIVDVSNTTVTVQMITHFKNGAEATDFGIMDVDTGNGNMTNWVVSANLNPNDTVYTSMFNTWKINETIVRTYPDGTRNTNHLNLTMESNMGSDYQYTSTNFFWDQSTGIMVESLEILISRLGGIQSNITVSVVITQSDLWAVPEFSAFASVLTLMITSAVIFVSYKRRNSVPERKFIFTWLSNCP